MASGRAPTGTPLKKAAQCAMCGGHLLPGELFVPITQDTFGESFNNKLDVKVDSAVICGDCDVLWVKEFLQNYSKSYASVDGVFKFASNEDVQAFLLTPPKPPFVAIFSTRQQQHMIWRTPVSYSAEVAFVRVDDEVVKINVARALEGARAWQLAERRMKELGLKGPPAILDRSLGAPDMGTVRRDVTLAMKKDGGANAQVVDTLNALGMGEWWALCALRYVKLDEPASWPKPIRVLPAAQ
jgi:CRISPR type IV-associated protein Csf1